MNAPQVPQAPQTQAMTVEVNPSRNVIMAGNNNRRVFILIELIKQAVAQTLAGQREMKFVLDVSGSTNDPAAPGSRETKLDVIKAGCVNFIDKMDENDLVSVTTFENRMERAVHTGSIKLQRQQAIDTVRKLRPLGGTWLSGALAHGVKAKKKGIITRASLNTDGNVNSGGPNDPSGANELADCLKVMTDPSAVPTWIVGVGVDYDPVFLQKLADAGPEGTFFRHVSNAVELLQVLEEQFIQLSSLGDITDVVIEAKALNGVTIEEATRLVPTHQPLKPSKTDLSYTHGDLDAFGQKVLLEVEVPAQDLYKQGQSNFNGDVTVDLLSYTVSYKQNNRPGVPFKGTVSVTITADQNVFNAAQLNQPVMTTVYTSAGQMATLAGDYNKAATMFTSAGNQTAAKGLQTLASGGLSEDGERSLKTQINLAGRNPLNTISS